MIRVNLTIYDTLTVYSVCYKMQDKQSYNFVENLRDHLESHAQGDVILTHCNAGQKHYYIAVCLSSCVTKWLKIFIKQVWKQCILHPFLEIEGTILAFNVEQRLLPLLNEKIITLGVNSNSPPNSFSVIPHTSAWDGQSEAFIMIAELHGDRFV